MRVIPRDTGRIILGLTDKLDLTSNHYNALSAAHDPSTNRCIICPVAPTGQRGHAVLFDTRFRENLCTIQGANKILKVLPEYVHEIHMSDDAVMRDLDTRGLIKMETLTTGLI